MARVEKDPALLEQVRVQTIAFLEKTSLDRSLSSSGLTKEPSFFKDLTSRLLDRFFPRPYAGEDLGSVVHRLEDKKAHPSILLDLEDEEIRRFLSIVCPKRSVLSELTRGAFETAMRTLVARVSHEGMSHRFWDRLDEDPSRREPIVRLSTTLESYLVEPSAEGLDGLKKRIEECQASARWLRQQRGERGISLALTFQISSIIERSNRLNLLLDVHKGYWAEADSNKIIRLTQEIIDAEVHPPRMGLMLRRYFSLVFFQVTEHTGKVGENYIARNSEEWNELLKKGLLGGLIVGFFAVLKPLSSTLSLAPAVEAFAHSIIYASIFVLIFLSRGVLATKQPAMTASVLAQMLDSSESPRSLWRMSELVVKTVRSQVAAVFGNILVAFPIASLSTYGLLHLGWDGFSASQVNYLITQINPLRSWSCLYYAFLTGIALSTVGVVAGSASNWFIFNQIPARLRRALTRWLRLSEPLSDRIVTWVSRHFSSLSGNIALGVVLGTIPVLGYVFGVPLDIRHVTFASAQLGIAAAHPGAIVSWEVFAACVAGTLLIGAINLIVSFGVTFFIVLESRGITLRQDRQLLLLCAKRFLKEPWTFLLPR